MPGSPLVASQPVSVSGTQIIGVDGKPLHIRGLNYFGFDNGNTAPDGIWQVRQWASLWCRNIQLCPECVCIAGRAQSTCRVCLRHTCWRRLVEASAVGDEIPGHEKGC